MSRDWHDEILSPHSKFKKNKRLCKYCGESTRTRERLSYVANPKVCHICINAIMSKVWHDNDKAFGTWHRKQYPDGSCPWLQNWHCRHCEI